MREKMKRDDLDDIDAMDIIADTFHVAKEDISGISVLKTGMTNRSFLFAVRH